LVPTVQPYLLATVAALLAAVDAAIVKAIAGEISAIEIYFFRSLMASIVILPFLLQGRGANLRTRYLPQHILRAAVKTVGLVLNIYAITVLPLPMAIAISFLTPIILGLGAVVLLGEQMDWRRLIAAFGGLVGVAIIIHPDANGLNFGIAVMLGSVIALAGNGLMMKRQTGVEPAARIVALNLLVTIPMALLCAIPFWKVPSGEVLLLLVGQGILAAIGQRCYAASYARMDLSLLAPFDFLRLPFAALFAVVVFQQLPDGFTLLGAAVIFTSTLLLFRTGSRHRRIGKDKRASL
jgi:drug/metabolite transporter (DMT)-like permease